MLVMDFSTSGTDEIFNIDSYIFHSIGGTLKSVQVIVSEGRINDGYALMRKYFDSVMLSVYVDLYLKDRQDDGEFAIKQVNDWLRGTKELPKYKVMQTYVANSSRLEPVLSILLNSDSRYKAIRNLRWSWFVRQSEG